MAENEIDERCDDDVFQIQPSGYSYDSKKEILAARRVERLDAIRQTIATKYPQVAIHVVALDVRHKQQIDQVVSELPESYKHIDVLVNNAGMVLGLDHLVDVNEEEFDTMFATNVKGLVFLTQAILPGMKARQTGHIINIGSVAGKQSYPGGSIYCATKHAVDAITKALTYELVDTPIRVSQICPGLVDTEFSTVRFRGDKEKADNVYKGIQPLVGQDIGNEN
ncbi:hypothetical protein EC973_006424 [Apophysomyces ossiformis]|uniref:NAD(P)-binding protein n=1 Tax=Apophysomyces ossiformis TaxID=679940 RepID=A0A8H7EUJ7_9FUNG|nr:hypothetical protein EC973_006424 [Apophysomyces ossiformis]